jgi:hypothetical protein
MKVSIIGGGNIAHSLSVFLGSNTSDEVFVLTNNYARWSSSISENNINSSIYRGDVTVSNDYEKYIPKSDVIIITVPAFAKKTILEKIKPFFNKKTWIGAFPGGPYFDLLVKKYLGKDTKFFASQRVPFISRIGIYGKSVLTYPKDEIHIAFSKSHDEMDFVNWMEGVLNLKVKKIPSFLQITLSNSNPILHPARLYSLFYNYVNGYVYEREYLFYEEWDDVASDLLISMDKELHDIINLLGINDLKLNLITDHYGVDGVKSLTKKIRNIESFKGIKAPMLPVDKGYIPDFNSRYFTEDFNFGLLVIKDFADLVSFATPMISKIITWASKFSNSYGSEDVLQLSEFGIKTINELHDEYR